MKENIVITLLYLNEYSQNIVGIVYLCALKLFTSAFKDTKMIIVKSLFFLLLTNTLFWIGVLFVQFLNEYFIGYKVIVTGFIGIVEEVVVIVIFSMSIPLICINKLLKLIYSKSILSMASYIFIFCLIYYFTYLASNHYFGFRQ